MTKGRPPSLRPSVPLSLSPLNLLPSVLRAPVRPSAVPPALGLWYCGTAGLWETVTVGLCDCGTLGTWDCGTVGLWECGTVGMWDCGNVGLWGYGTLGLWDDGTLRLWDVGTLGRSKPWGSRRARIGRGRSHLESAKLRQLHPAFPARVGGRGRG
jgi:hypothetical protein